MVISHAHCLWDHHQKYLQEKNPLVQLDPQHLIEPTPSRRRTDFTLIMIEKLWMSNVKMQEEL